jgi:hypothetical protein
MLAGVIATLPTLASAQFPPPPPPPSAGGPPPVQDRWPQPASPGRPVQTEPQRPSQAQPDQPAQQAAPAPRPRAPAAPATTVACSGVFGKDSTHLKLAIKYDSRNIVFGEVDGPDGTRLNASIIYPNDPRRRLEVLWNNEGSRSDTQLIAINGRSQWTAPKGLKLGLPLAALEKANGRPFKVSGVDQQGYASVTSWEGGALSALPGGCRVGIRLAADGKAPEEARGAVSGDKSLSSNDPALRAVKATVAEILIGY